jgi:predicted Ser/Thr protein kinase
VSSPIRPSGFPTPTRPSGAEGSRSPTHQETPDARLRQACAELERRLRAGEPCRAEDLLSAYPDLASSADLACHLIFTEFTIREQLGEQPRPEEWYARFPEYRELLRRQLDSPGTLSEQPEQPATIAEPLDRAPDEQGPLPRPPGGLLERYQVLEELGRGGMGIVYKARDLLLGRLVALKRVRGGRAGSDEVLRFQREAQAVARLRHRHIVALFDFGEHEGEPFFTMAYVGGGNLALRRDEFCEPRAAVALLEKVARAVQAAHEQGIIHRDLKPANILLDEDGEPQVGDFGLAKFLDPEPATDPTYTGQLVGTPAYMAPEQAAGHGHRATPATDVWSLGVVLYELLTRRRPFPGPGPETTRQILSGEPPRPRSVRPGLDRSLETIVLACLEKEPARRYPTAGALADDLGRWLRGEPVQVRPAGWPRRLGRALRRHPAISGALLLVGLLTLAAPLGLSLADPNRPARAIDARLARHEAVPLIGETGPPAWCPWVMRGGGIIQSERGDGTFTLSAQQASLLELVRDGRQDYRFRVEVCQHDASRLGVVGLYFAHTRLEGRKGPEHCFCTVSFSDIEALFADPNGNGMSSKVSLQVQRHRDADEFDAYTEAASHPFAPARLVRQAPCPWRKLAVVVTSRLVEVSWEGAAVISVPTDDLKKRFHILKLDREGRDDCPELDPDFGPRGGLGLYVTRSEVSFRNAALEPLP